MKEEPTLKTRSQKPLATRGSSGTGKLSGGKLTASSLKYPVLAALITAVCFCLMLLISQKYPFGRYTTLISDLEAQYAPYLFLYRAKLLAADWGRFISDFGYSFSLGAGKNFAGTFGYYLASPLNLLVLLFKPEQANEFVMLLMGIKLSLAAAFMSMFIEERAEKKGTFWPAVWGVMYAFSSYTMLFLFHIMWLDGYMLLPLLLFFIERYLKNKKLTGVTVVLLLLFLSNYYIAYMAGIYSFIYLLSRMYLTGMFTKEHRPVTVITRFISRAICAGLTLGVILVPVGLDTIRNADPTHSADRSDYVGFSLTSIFDRIFMGYAGEFNDVLISNMPLIYVSSLVTFLCVLYLVSRSFTGKAKKFYTVCFVLIYFTLAIDALDVAWQVFDSPNWFWHRESFVFITFFLTLSYQVFEHIKEVTNKEIIKTAGILGIILLLAHSFGDMKDHGILFVFNLCIIIAVTLFLTGLKKEKWGYQMKDMGKILPVLLAGCVIYECAFLAPLQSAGTATLSIGSTEGEDFVVGMMLFEDYAEASNLLNNGFRNEHDCFYTDDYVGVAGSAEYTGYRGITIFNSNSNKMFGRFLKQLGYAVNYNYFSADCSYQAPATDAFFSVGTIYSTADSYLGADRLAENEEMSFYVNRSVLPLAFAADRDARSFDFYRLETATGADEKNYFDFQNDWYRSLFPCFTEDFYLEVNDADIEEELVNASVINIWDYQNPADDSEEEASEAASPLAAGSSSSDDFDPDDLGLEVVSDYFETQTEVFRTNKNLPIILNYTITVTRPDELYLNISVPRMNSGCEVWLNGENIANYAARTFYSSILRLGAYEPGETVQVTIMADYDMWTCSDINFAYFDLEGFEAQFVQIDDQAVRVTEADDGYVTLEADVQAGDMILTSIPYEDGWTAYIDGEQTDIIPYEDALISLDAEPGHHDIRLVFAPPGLKAGAALSVIGIAGLIVVSLMDKKRYNSKSKNTVSGG